MMNRYHSGFIRRFLARRRQCTKIRPDPFLVGINRTYSLTRKLESLSLPIKRRLDWDAIEVDAYE